MIHFNYCVVGAGEDKRSPPSDQKKASKDTGKKAANKNGTDATTTTNDIRPAKSKADRVEVAPARPSKQRQEEEPLKENKKPTAATPPTEDFPSLGEYYCM